jgi:hypothetical protein
MQSAIAVTFLAPVVTVAVALVAGFFSLLSGGSANASAQLPRSQCFRFTCLSLVFILFALIFVIRRLLRAAVSKTRTSDRRTFLAAAAGLAAGLASSFLAAVFFGSSFLAAVWRSAQTNARVNESRC